MHRGKEKIRGEKVMKTSPRWRSVNQVRRLKIMMTVVAVVLLVSVGAGIALVWYHISPVLPWLLPNASSAGSEAGEESSAAEQDWDSLNLVLVNSLHMLPPDYEVSLTEAGGVMVEKRIADALLEMQRAAKEDGVGLKLSKGYVSAQEQEKLYQKRVKELTSSGYSQVKAEAAAQNTVERGGYSEYQTGLAVEFSAGKSGFEKSGEYKWLIEHGVDYGFVERFPKNKESTTGKTAEPGHFRYVGEENAKRMRQMGMCLEEYTAYLDSQSQK